MRTLAIIAAAVSLTALMGWGLAVVWGLVIVVALVRGGIETLRDLRGRKED